ncbi:organic solvent tolerance protein, partial [Candidatus Pelagibacter sp.]|nr:organic solvent tolerance protein [Candidatus Pelagibacter sp.]
SQDVFYNLENKVLISKNSSTIADSLGNKFKLKSFNYDLINEIIKSDEDSIAKDNLGNIFKMKGFIYTSSDSILRLDNAEIQDTENNKFRFKKAYLNLISKKLIGKDMSIDFSNRSFHKDNEPRLNGVSASIDQNQSIIKKGVFTTCKRNDNCPPWKLSAQMIKHDREKKRIEYQNAWLSLYNQPVVYFPKFFHPDPSVKRQSGFLMPTFEDSISVGSSFGVPYYHVLADNKDFTVKPRFYSDQKKILLQSEYRHVNKKSNHIVDFSYKNEKSVNDKSHFFSRTIKEIELTNFEDSELNFQLQKTSDDTYLKTYKLESPLINGSNTLTSSLGLTAYREDLTFDTELKVYEDLSKKGSDRYEFLYPTYELNKYFSNNNFSLNSSGYLKNYNTNTYETVIVNDLIYNSDSHFSDNGFKNNYNILVKNVNTESKKSAKYRDKRDHQMMSIIEYNSSYPLKKQMENYSNILKPMVSLKFSPNNTKNLKNEYRRIDINNIFNINRIGQSDTVESGASITYGTEFSKIDDSNKEILGIKVANVLRLDENENLPANSALGSKTSAIVGGINYSPNNILKMKYDFSIDENLSDKNYEILSSEFKVNNFITTFDYLNENNTSEKNSYIANKTKYALNESKSLSFETRINKKTKLTEFYDLIYQYRNDCLIAAIEYNRDYYADRDLKPNETIFFKLTIIPFGETSSPNLKQ